MAGSHIVATLGPACADAPTLKAMIEAGADMFRINFSQCTLDEHAVRLDLLRQAGRAAGRPIRVVGDLCGPRFRVGLIEPDCQVLCKGRQVVIAADGRTGTADRFSTNYDHFTEDVAVGDGVYIDEGRICLRVVEKRPGDVICEVVQGGQIRSRKGINLPDSHLSAGAVTQGDWECVRWAREQGIEWLALSFVHSAHDVRALRQGLADSVVKVMAKIETRQALSDLEAIIREADAVLLARGDLGVEVDWTYIPVLQKQVCRLCQLLDRPLYVATHLLHSMIHQPSPTRAEACDLVNAVLDGASGVVFTGETAVGAYPVDVILVAQRLIRAAEGYRSRQAPVLSSEE